MARNPRARASAEDGGGLSLGPQLSPAPEVFGPPVGRVTVREVDAYRSAKLREGKIAPAQINKTIKRLAQILDAAIEYELISGANHARGRRRMVRAPKVNRSWVEPEQLPALLAASRPWFRPVVALLAGAGLRIGEAIALDWQDVNLATANLRVGRAKTDAGSFRDVDLPAGLVEALTEWRAISPRTRPHDPVLLTRTRRRQTDTNVSHRLKTTIKRANLRLGASGVQPVSQRVSPHSLRRTYASLRAACGDDPVYIAEQLGHTDPAFTFRVYQKAAKRRERLSGAYLEAFDWALDWAALGSKPSETADSPKRRSRPSGDFILDQAIIDPSPGSSAG